MVETQDRMKWRTLVKSARPHTLWEKLEKEDPKLYHPDHEVEP